MNSRLPILLPCLFATALPGQMGKRWIDQYHMTAFAQAAPALGSKAPGLRLWDLDGRPRSLGLEHGRSIVLIGAAYT